MCEFSFTKRCNSQVSTSLHVCIYFWKLKVNITVYHQSQSWGLQRNEQQLAEISYNIRKSKWYINWVFSFIFCIQHTWECFYMLWCIYIHVTPLHISLQIIFNGNCVQINWHGQLIIEVSYQPAAPIHQQHHDLRRNKHFCIWWH